VDVISRDRDRAWLERELQRTEYQKLLGRLRARSALLAQFGTWAEVVAFMRTATWRDPRTDGILRSIFDAHAEDNDPRWHSILLLVFWPALEFIYFKKCRWVSDPSERWVRITWAFIQVLCRIDVTRRPDRLAQKIFNDTLHRFYSECRRGWNRMRREYAVDPEVIDVLAGGVEDLDIAAADLRRAQEASIGRLRQHVEGGWISEADFLLLVGTRVYRKSVADYARDSGLNYQVAKKRRQRAEAAIARFERRER
jgi:hypothetical protein